MFAEPHIHIRALCSVTGSHIVGVFQWTGIPRQHGRDKVRVPLVSSLYYPVSGPQSMKGVCL